MKIRIKNPAIEHDLHIVQNLLWQAADRIEKPEDYTTASQQPEQGAGEQDVKMVKCDKCDREFKRPLWFVGRIVCESCDPFMKPAPIQPATGEQEWKEWAEFFIGEVIHKYNCTNKTITEVKRQFSEMLLNKIAPLQQTISSLEQENEELRSELSKFKNHD